MSALVLDTETTSLDGEVIELAFMGPLDTILSDAIIGSLRFKPSVPIAIGAMAAHHIIEEDLQDCPPWPGKWDIPAGIDYIVGHNVDFDWKMIGSPNIKRICTLALARWLWPKLDSHTLTALIYSIYPHAMARELVKNAHSAEKDVDLCWRVLGSIVLGTKPQDWDHLYQLSETARVPTIMPMGKHKGLPISEVPRDYKRWLLGQLDVDPYLVKALKAGW